MPTTNQPGNKRKAIPFHIACEGDNAPLICGDALPIFAAFDGDGTDFTVDDTGSIGNYVRLTVGAVVGAWIANPGTYVFTLTVGQKAALVDAAVVTLEVSNDNATALSGVSATVYTGAAALSTVAPTVYNAPTSATIPACTSGTAAYTEVFDEVTSVGSGTATIAPTTGIITFSAVAAAAYKYYAYRKCDGTNVEAIVLITATSTAH